jgi:PAS domain S-box-containing protein
MLIDASHDAIVTMDASGCVGAWNLAATRLFGWSREEAHGRPVGDLIIPPESRAAHEAAWRRRAGTPYDGRGPSFELQAMRRDESRVHVHLALSGLGARPQFVAFIRDITDEVRERERQAELMRAKHFTDLVLENTGLLIARVGLDGTFLAVNDRVCETLGYSEAELLQFTVGDVLAPHELEHVQGAFALSAEGGRVSRFDVTVSTKSGEARQLSFGLTPVHEDGVLQSFIGAAEDVTDQQRTRDALANNEKLSSLASLAGGVAHDFNNLLAVILGNVAVIRALADGDPQREDALSDIETASQQAAELAKQMLSYAGRAESVKVAVDLRALVSNSVPLLRAVLPRNVDMRVEFEGPAQVIADVTQLRQVLLNVVMNAAEALGPESGSVTIRVATAELDAEALAGLVGGESSLAGPYASMSVSDTGPGMAPDVRRRVFDPFFTTRFAGRGLGLSAVFGIVRGHHGVLDVESVPGEGATFTVYLPSAMPASQLPEPAAPSASVPA